MRDDERLERKLTPLRRELEMLRTQTFVDTKFAETYRRMDVERKEMREEMQKLREEKDGLRKELDTLTAQFHTMVDDYTVIFLVLCFSPVKLFESIRRFDHYTVVIISDLQI